MSVEDKTKFGEATGNGVETPEIHVVPSDHGGIDGAALARDPHRYVEVSRLRLRLTLYRGLRMRHVQLIAISGSIGAALFVSIGNPLTSAGPLGLLIGVILWCSVVYAASNCLIEMTTLHPVDGGFIAFAGRFVDESFGMALGWNVSDGAWRE